MNHIFHDAGVALYVYTQQWNIVHQHLSNYSFRNLISIEKDVVYKGPHSKSHKILCNSYIS